jgi:hypothetical protein
MRFNFQIANRFTLLGMFAVLVGAGATAAGFIWQEFITLRFVQNSYLGAVALAGQMELNRQALSEGELTGVAPLNWENETRMRMRLQTVEIPPALQNLGLEVEVVAPRQSASSGAPVVKSPPISILPICQKCVVQEPDPAHMDNLIYRVMAGTSWSWMTPATAATWRSTAVITGSSAPRRSMGVTGVWRARSSRVSRWCSCVTS